MGICNALKISLPPYLHLILDVDTTISVKYITIGNYIMKKVCMSKEII